MNDVERWIKLEGPEPPGIHDLLESVREVPDLTPEEDAALARSIHAAIAARRRRDRLVRTAAAGSVVALAAAAAVIGFWHFAPRSVTDAASVTTHALDTAPPGPPARPGATAAASASAPPQRKDLKVAPFSAPIRRPPRPAPQRRWAIWE